MSTQIAPLTPEQEKRWYSKFFYQRYAPDPDALREIGDNGPLGLENAFSVADRTRVLDAGYHTRERGWQVMPDGTTFVQGMLFMKDVTPQMFQWWFSWMPADPLRMRIWDPTDHYSMYVSEDTARRICDPALTVPQRIHGNLLYAVEDNGTGYESDRFSYKKLNFRPPEDFGFTAEQIARQEALGATITTAMSGPKGGEFVSSFVHYARPAKGGCEVRSWFFVGYKMENGQLRKTMADDMSQAALEQIGRGLTLHCLREYSNLSHILPEVYARCSQHVDTPAEYESYRYRSPL